MKIFNLDFNLKNTQAAILDAGAVFGGAVAGAMLLKATDKIIKEVPVVNGFFAGIDSEFGSINLKPKAATWAKAAITTTVGIGASVYGMKHKNNRIRLAGLGCVMTGVNEVLQKVILKRNLMQGFGELADVQVIDYADMSGVDDMEHILDDVQGYGDDESFDAIPLNSTDYSNIELTPIVELNGLKLAS